MSNEDRGPVAGSRGGAPDLLERSAESVYSMIQQAPDLKVDGPPPAPPEGGSGDHLPERDWAIIGLLVLIAGLSFYSGVRATFQLWREFRS